MKPNKDIDKTPLGKTILRQSQGESMQDPSMAMLPPRPKEQPRAQILTFSAITADSKTKEGLTALGVTMTDAHQMQILSQQPRDKPIRVQIMYLNNRVQVESKPNEPLENLLRKVSTEIDSGGIWLFFLHKCNESGYHPDFFRFTIVFCSILSVIARPLDLSQSNFNKHIPDFNLII